MWKEAIIRPVTKVGTTSSPSDFRPISNVSQSDFQSGFRRGQRIATALVRVIWDLRSAKACGEGRCSSNHHGLFVHKHISSAQDMTLILQLWVSSFLRDRSMVVEVDGVKSTPRSLSSGVYQ
jgi:hypothetical protein